MPATPTFRLSFGEFRATVWPHGVMVSLGNRWTWLSNPLRS